MLHPRVQEQRELWDNKKSEALANYGVGPNQTIEEALLSQNFTLDKVFANLPYGIPQIEARRRYSQKQDNHEISGCWMVPAWWLPSVMETLSIKDLVPFAFYIKK